MKYSDFMCLQLKNMGYTHCFTLTGGNIMHLIESASNYFEMVPVVNEVAAGIAVEYFNESNPDKKAFALVTAGPGLTNIITAISGAYLESRELLVIGGQVKVDDLSRGSLRQNGIQEIDGVSLTKSITNHCEVLEKPIISSELSRIILKGSKGRKGPVFIEVPLDVQAKNVDEKEFGQGVSKDGDVALSKITEKEFLKIVKSVNNSKRPVILLGGGVKRETVLAMESKLSKLNIPIQLTWNAADRIGSDHDLYFGRPNTWGQRYANVIIQQSDLLIAVGDRLGFQQSGFNWQEFIPNGKIIHIDIDESELNKGHPATDQKIKCDANDFIEKFVDSKIQSSNFNDWVSHCRLIKKELPLNESWHNPIKNDYILSYDLCEGLSDISSDSDIIIPCSSGGAYTSMMQVFEQKKGQTIISNKALASMGYGLSGAIGCAIANPEKRVILTEGDGGFSQNLQELAIVDYHRLNLKIFLFENSGYASIRMTQKNYFNGKYVGCDNNTGLGFPDWFKLFDAYNIKSHEINSKDFVNNEIFLDYFNSDSPVAFIVRIDPEQTYLPKIASKVAKEGGMVSNPLHIMSPELDDKVKSKLIKYI